MLQNALRTCADLARRPWLDTQAQTIDAVLFLDEAELMACLVRDGLRGRLHSAWWWRSVIGDLDAGQWIRRFVLPRGDVMPTLLALLASEDCAIAWLRQLSQDDVAVALSAVVDAFALHDAMPADSGRPEPVAPRFVSGHLRDDRGKAAPVRVPVPPNAGAQAPGPESARLFALVPELAGCTLGVWPRRLLATALALRRDAAWVRSGGLAKACAALDANPAAGVSAPTYPAVDPWRPTTVPAPPTSSRAGLGTNEHARLPQRLPGIGAGGSDRAGDASCTAPRLEAPQAPTGFRFDASLRDASPGPSTAADAAPEAPVRRLPTPAVQGGLASRSPHTIDTDFGGILYVLNAVLELGLYGDFTQPRHQNIALSPWSLLVWMGRHWFGTAFTEDALCALLSDWPGLGMAEGPEDALAALGDWQVSPAWLAPWPVADSLVFVSGRRRLQLWHPAGFCLCDLARRAGWPPRQQSAHAAAAMGLGAAALVQGGQPLPPAALSPPQPRWLAHLAGYLQARLLRALGDGANATPEAVVCRHAARVRLSDARLDVHLSLDTLPLSLRMAGLDRDPGWIPAAGRSIHFHFA